MAQWIRARVSDTREFRFDSGWGYQFDMTSSSNPAQDTALSRRECGVQIPPRSQKGRAEEFGSSPVCSTDQKTPFSLLVRPFRSHRPIGQDSGPSSRQCGVQIPLGALSARVAQWIRALVSGSLLTQNLKENVPVLEYPFLLWHLT